MAVELPGEGMVRQVHRSGVRIIHDAAGVDGGSRSSDGRCRATGILVVSVHHGGCITHA